MKQLLLKLDPDRPPTLDSFVEGQHAELIALLRLFEQRRPSSFGERAVYLWGESGAGKSHLLHALHHTSATQLLNPACAIDQFEYLADTSLVLLDDCQLLDPQQQIAAFNLYNQVREQGGFFVASGTLPPALLTVREDLRTRLGWGLIYQLHGLTDQEKIDALERAAAARGVTVPGSVLPYLITHFQRDMPALSGMLNAVINLSLEIKRPITLPFVREVMQEQNAQQRATQPIHD